MLTKRLVALTLAALVLLPTHAAAGPRTIRGGFDARAVPGPSPTIYWLNGDCLGREGADTVSQRFVPPFDGALTATITTAAGGWTLRIEEVLPPGSAQGGRLAKSTSQIDGLPLRRNQAVEISACNWRGALDARVDYEFRSIKLPSFPVPRRPITHTETGSYVAPLLGTVAPIRYELACGTGCVEFEPDPTDRFITAVSVDDLADQEVSLIVYQSAELWGSYQERYFCTKVDEPIELIPEVSWVGVSPAVGPCMDGTPAVATSGTVTITFSSHRV